MNIVYLVDYIAYFECILVSHLPRGDNIICVNIISKGNISFTQHVSFVYEAGYHLS